MIENILPRASMRSVNFQFLADVNKALKRCAYKTQRRHWIVVCGPSSPVCTTEPRANFVRAIPSDTVGAVTPVQVVFPEIAYFPEKRIDFCGISVVVGAVEPHQHGHGDKGCIAFHSHEWFEFKLPFQSPGSHVSRVNDATGVEHGSRV